jgi:hypothetical protein
MKNFIVLIICNFLFVQSSLFGQSHKLDGLWINVQYKMFKEDKNQDLPINCRPQYIEIDSLGKAVIFNFEHQYNLGLPKSSRKFGSANQYIYKKNQTYYITEISDTNKFISVEINNSGFDVLFERIRRPWEN